MLTNNIKDGLEHLSDTVTYESIDEDPTKPLGTAINAFVANVAKKGIIDRTTKDYLTFVADSQPRTQQLYFLKKIHKNPIAVRPIVSGCSGPTEKILQLIDMQLQPFVPKIKSYIKDTGDFIKLVESSNNTLAVINVNPS